MGDKEHKKSKKRRKSDASDGDKEKEDSSSNKKPKKEYEERLQAVNVISHPMASKKSTKKLHKLVHKAAASKKLRRGVKEVTKALRKGEKGLAVLAGDIYPIDVVSHLPVLLEEHGIPYLFVPSKQDLGASASTKRPTSCVLVQAVGKKDDGFDIYDAMVQEAKEYDPSRLNVK